MCNPVFFIMKSRAFCRPGDFGFAVLNTHGGPVFPASPSLWLRYIPSSLTCRNYLLTGSKFVNTSCALLCLLGKF